MYLQDERAILVSTDNIHRPGSVKQLRTTCRSVGNSVLSYQLGHQSHDVLTENPLASGQQTWRTADFEQKMSDTIMFEAPVFPTVDLVAPQSNPKATYSVLGEFLYGLENLRKNRSSNETGEADDVGDGREPAEDIA